MTAIVDDVVGPCPKCLRGKLVRDGVLVFCRSCAYEPPESASRPVSVPLEDEEPVKPGVIITSADDMAKACQARITQIDWQVRKLSSQVAVLKDESARLGKVLALLSPKGAKVPRAKVPGDPSGLEAREAGGPYPCEKCGREFGLPTSRGMHQKHCHVLGVG